MEIIRKNHEGADHETAGLTWIVQGLEQSGKVAPPEAEAFLSWDLLPISTRG